MQYRTIGFKSRVIFASWLAITLTSKVHGEEQKKCTCGGDEAMIETYEASIGGTNCLCRVLYVKRKDIAVAVLGVGKEGAFKEFGRSIEIVAQSISFKESALDASLVGTWMKE